MAIILYIAQGLFALMAIRLVLRYGESKHIGLILGAIAYGGAAITSFGLMAWWPLVAGFAIAWVLRLLGFDPSPP